MFPKFLTNPDPNVYFSDNFVVLDVETTNLKKGNALEKSNRLLVSVWYDGLTKKYTTNTASEYMQGELVKRCLEADFIVAHNAKMELGWLARCGLDISRVIVFDTMIAEYVLAGNQKVPLGLGMVSLRRGLGTKSPYVDTLMRAGVCPSEIMESYLIDRCRLDVRQTLGIFLQQREELKNGTCLKTFYTHCLLTPVLTDIESNGMHLDKEEVLKLTNEVRQELAAIDAELREFTGGVNLRSVKQMKELLYTTLGFKPLKIRGEEVYGTDVDTIKELKCTNKKQRRFIELKVRHGELSALLSKNLEFFEGVVKEQNCVFHAQFNQAVTQTHRLSSSGIPLKFSMFDRPKSVQFQNMPRNLKRLFKARHEGWKMGEGDGSQLEFRVDAFMGQDPVACTSIVNKEDIHSFTASVLTQAGQETTRQGAKAHTFKPLYGGSSGTEAEQAYYAAFKAKYKGIAAMQRTWIDTVLRTKELLLPTGLKFYWPDTKVTRSGYVTNTPNICNYPVQYFATAEIIPIGLVFFWHFLKIKGAKSFLVNTIHDSIIGEVAPGEEELFKTGINECMTYRVYEYLDSLYGIKFNVPLGTGVKISEHWAMTDEEFKFESTPPYSL